jgi:hypothetical protein
MTDETRRRRFIGLSGLAAIVLLVGALGWMQRAALAVWLAPAKVATGHMSESARRANDRFWNVLHGGRYEELPALIETLTAAYLENPRDAATAAHIAFSHVWFASERSRLDRVPATITEHLALARRYFAEAVRLAPTDERYKGFLASMELAEAKIHGDEKLLRRGYFNLMASVDGWPEFNLFTAGYVLSGLPFNDPMYAEAVDYEWRNIDVCVGEKFDRRGADATKYLALETTTGPKRACWNSSIAPHNFEGFFLNLGDMLVKQGDADTARRVYAYAKLSKTYAQWPFRTVLEERISQAEENIALFRNPKPGERTRTMMAHSAFSCTGCHQQ